MRTVSIALVFLFVLYLASAKILDNYDRVNGFHLNKGEHLDFHLHKGDRINARWNIYQFVKVSFAGFENDETVKITLSDHAGNQVSYNNIKVDLQEFEVPISRVIPSSEALLTITGEQSGETASFRNININSPRAHLFK